MLRVLSIALVLALATAPSATAAVSGHYLEARTCSVYTGPCFANGEVGIAGKDAVMAWKIRRGEFQGVDLAGLSVVVVVAADTTLGHEGVDDAEELKTMILTDKRADRRQKDALVAFAKRHAGRAGENIVCVRSSAIKMHLDTSRLLGSLQAGKSVELTTRKAGEQDCICSNESGFYPPLASVNSFAPGVSLTGDVKAHALGTRWSIPNSRSAYMGTFSYPAETK